MTMWVQERFPECSVTAANLLVARIGIPESALVKFHWSAWCAMLRELPDGSMVVCQHESENKEHNDCNKQLGKRRFHEL